MSLKLASKKAVASKLVPKKTVSFEPPAPPPTAHPQPSKPQRAQTRAQTVVSESEDEKQISFMVPPGGPSHVKDTDFPILTGWNKAFIATFEHAIETLTSEKFDPNLSLSDQDLNIKAEIVAEIQRAYPAVNSFIDLWPLEKVMIRSCKNSAAKRARSTEKTVVKTLTRTLRARNPWLFDVHLMTQMTTTFVHVVFISMDENHFPPRGVLIVATTKKTVSMDENHFHPLGVLTVATTRMIETDICPEWFHVRFPKTNKHPARKNSEEQANLEYLSHPGISHPSRPRFSFVPPSRIQGWTAGTQAGTRAFAAGSQLAVDHARTYCPAAVRARAPVQSPDVTIISPRLSPLPSARDSAGTQAFAAGSQLLAVDHARAYCPATVHSDSIASRRPMSIRDSDSIASSRLYDFQDSDKLLLAAKSRHRCSICRISVEKQGAQEARSGEAAHWIGASFSIAHIPQLAVAAAHCVIAPTEDPGTALHVNDVRYNALWLCSNCHTMLGKNNFLVCPPLKILRALRENFDPRSTNMQAFLELVYANEFPELRHLYHFVRISPRPVDMYLGPSKIVKRGHERFRLQNSSTTGKVEQIPFDNETSLTEPPSIWRFPCLAPENVMAVLLHITGRPAPHGKVSLMVSPPTSASNFNDQLLSHLFGLKAGIITQLLPPPHLAPLRAVLESDSETGDTEEEEEEDIAEELTEDSDDVLTDGFSYGVEHVLNSKAGGKRVLGNISNAAGERHILGGKDHNGQYVLGDHLDVPDDEAIRTRVQEWINRCEMSEAVPV
ncbi:hypothetical protein GGX14DRAFT_399567 [Mycena pura]|uniref:Uncharacterized protein n=1 Tax=Mycena pura TaxID=153505 RepID=A0AAD6YAJ5_9AGAR|nr:hypothetical protein GGX14DRAFT_399567 [Mycena pura]